jgi:RNA polymerase sigma-70 factor (ECF subfamily)
MFKSLLKQMSPITASANSDYASLVKRIIDDDAAAEAELIAIFKDRVSHIIRRIAKDTSMAEDFSQDTLFTVIKKIRNGDLQQPESLGFFIASVARYHALEQMRGIRRWASEDLKHAEHVQDPSPSPLEQLQTSEKLKEIREVIDQLIPRDQTLILRLYINEEPKEVICAGLGLTSEQFDRILHRARKRFKALYLKRKRLLEGDEHK